MALHLLAFSITLILIAYKYYRRPRFNLPPGPRPLPIIGNLLAIKSVRWQCFAEWAQVYGPIISVWLGSTLNVVVSNPKLAKEVLKDNDRQLADRGRLRLTNMISKDGRDFIWADYGPHYVKLRRVCTLELFSPKSIDALRPIREAEVITMVESIFSECTNHRKSLLVRKYLGEVAFNNLTRSIFGKRFVNSKGEIDDQGRQFKEINGNELKLGGDLPILEHIPWLRWVMPLKEKEFMEHVSRRTQLILSIIEEHRLSRKKIFQAQPQQHLLDTLLCMKDEYGLCEETIVGLLWDMITASMDTSAVSVEWALAQVVRNPRVQQKAQEELDQVIGPNRAMNESDFPNLPYLRCIVKEALRLHPPTPMMLPHRAKAHVKIGGYDIPKGSNVLVNVWAIARDPTVWKDPLEFWPERFLEEDVDMKGHEFRLLPFGAGRRACPGAQLGINLVTSMIGHLLHHFHWALPKGVEPDMINMTESPGLVSYMKTPLEVVPTPRLPRNLSMCMNAH